MKSEVFSTRQAPAVNTRDLTDRKLAEAQVLSANLQLDRFDELRARSASKGLDGETLLHALSERRERAAEDLRRVAPPAQMSDSAFHPRTRMGEPLIKQPLAAARYHSHLGLFGLGSSGVVQMGRPADHVGIVPQGPHPVSGEIYTTSLNDKGVISFNGDLHVGPASAPPSRYSPEIRYFWLRNWAFLVPFPAPAVTSIFTYRFDVTVLASLFCEGGLGTFMSFVSVGETADLSPGDEVMADHDAGWPLVADLGVPNSTTGAYNGRYGYLAGHCTVQRSFRVEGGRVPAVAIVVGAIAGLPMMERLRLHFPAAGHSGIATLQQNQLGRVSYHFEPEPVLEPAFA